MSNINQLSTEFQVDFTRTATGIHTLQPTGNLEVDPSAFPEFCKDICYNYFSSGSGQGEIAPKFNNTRVLYLNNVSKIYTLEVKSAYISYWGDVWLNKDKEVVDPEIFRLNLQNNLINSFSIEEKRSKLQYLDLSGNRFLSQVYLPLVPELQILKLNRVRNLESIVVSSDQAATLNRLEFKQGVIRPGILAGMSFSDTPGLIDISGSELDLNQDDEDTLEFLDTLGYSVIR